MNSARILASVSKYAGIVLCAASMGMPGVALTLPSAAEAAQASKASKPVARKATNKHVKKAGKPALSRVAKASSKRSKFAAIKSNKQQAAKQTPHPATQMAGIAVPGFALLQVAGIRPGVDYVYQDSDFRTESPNSAPRMTVQYPDAAHVPRKAAVACRVNGEVFLLADCNTESGAASGPDSHFGIGWETTAASKDGLRSDE
ncbi:MAG: hypothetical protein D4R84_16880 [Rhodocyclaceae bacterium]|nr:MAG: hypothetical protein D4R84_16880 [Rhodocyclaceae bacterium]